jgi:hypothetical protein
VTPETSSGRVISCRWLHPHLAVEGGGTHTKLLEAFCDKSRLAGIDGLVQATSLSLYWWFRDAARIAALAQAYHGLPVVMEDVEDLHSRQHAFDLSLVATLSANTALPDFPPFEAADKDKLIVPKTLFQSDIRAYQRSQLGDVAPAISPYRAWVSYRLQR